MVTGLRLFLNRRNSILWTAHRMAHYATLNQLDQQSSAEVGSRNAQVALFTAERQGEFLSVVAFSKTFITHGFVYTKGNLVKLS